MMHVILLGPPGAGKGTQASFLMREYGLAKLSTGDMLRSAASLDNDLGRRLKAIMASGALVEDALMIDLIRNAISQPQCAKGFILDGFPRTVAQAEALDSMLANEHRSLDHVIELQVNDTLLVERISGRYACSSCGEGYHDHYKHPASAGICDICGSSMFTRREDDRAVTVAKRLEAYHEQTAPLLPYYNAHGVLRTVDGMASMEVVTHELKRILEGNTAVAV